MTTITVTHTAPCEWAKPTDTIDLRKACSCGAKKAGAAHAGPTPGGATPLPPPGVQYESIAAINWSSLKHLAVSPLLYRWRLSHPKAATPAMVLGTAIHCAVLEPDKLDSRFAVYDGTRRGKAWEEWQVDHPGVQSLKPDERERVQQASAAVLAHREAAKLLRGCRHEEPQTWTDPETGLACKGRLDAIGPSYLLDLKTASSIEEGMAVAPRTFTRTAAARLYHGQLAWYHDGATLARKIQGDVPPYVIAVESDEPFDVGCYQLTPETLAAGRALYRSLLRRLEQCLAADYWPGVAPDLMPLELPAWTDVPTTETEGF